MAVRSSGGRASILGAQMVDGFQGTTLVIVADESGTAYKAVNSIGAIIYSPNISIRMVADKEAGTTIVHPQPGYFRADTEYAFAINPGLGYLALMATAAATAQITWVLGAGP